MPIGAGNPGGMPPPPGPMGGGGGGPMGQDELLRLAMQRLLQQQGGGGGGAPNIVNNVYGSLGGGGASTGIPPAFGGGGTPSGGPGPAGDPYAEDPRDYMVDIVRQNIPPGGTARLTDPQDPSRVLQEMPMGEGGGWVKRVHRWTRPKKKADPAGMQVDPMAPYGR